MSTVEPQRPEGGEGEFVVLADVAFQPLAHPPAVRHRCACGKDGTAYSHGHNPVTGHRALTCAEVLEIRSRVGGKR